MNKPGFKKRIAIIYRHVSGMSGVPGIILDHASRLSDRGYEITLIAETLDKSRILQTRAKTIRIRKWPLPKLQRLRWFSKRADRLAEHYDFVIGHGHNMRQHVLHVHNCLHLAHEKTHGGGMQLDDPTALQQEQMLTQGSYGFCIANSRLMQQDLIRRYGISEDKIAIVYPGSDLTRFNPNGRAHYRDQARAELRVDNATLLLGLITSGNFLKRGVDIAIKAFAQLPGNSRNRAKLLIIGKEPSLERYQQLVDKYGLKERIHFLPPTPQVEYYYHALDVYVHPARFEEFGLSVQEAMACGLPVIASQQVGAMELLSQQAWQSLPSELNVATLNERLQIFIEDEKLRRQWRDYGFEAVAKNSDTASFQNVLRVYKQAGL